MIELKDERWISRLSLIEHAFQPIVNIHTGNSFGFEALLRNYKEAGFSSIDDVFNQAYEEKMLHQVDTFLLKKALKKFSAFKKNSNIKLFYNRDNRLYTSIDYISGITAELIGQFGFSMDDLCFEISEKHLFRPCCPVTPNNNLGTYHTYRFQGFKVAVDDCGTGFSGLQLLYDVEPDYIKIDRFFITNIEKDSKKRNIVSLIVDFSHSIGGLVVAEGIETLKEYSQCKEMGCDLVQGFFIQRPEMDINRLEIQYDCISNISKLDQRNSSHDLHLISDEIEYIEPSYKDSEIVHILDRFREDIGATFFPIINRQNEPVGVVRESVFKQYIFSKFGRQLLENPSHGKDLSKFISRMPIADIHLSVEKLIETYTHFNNNEGLIIVDNMKYIGTLSTKSMLKLINEKNLTLARNQNPLTKLPGNTLIYEYFSKCLDDIDSTYHLVYFDFDNFKPFNDKYGFRNGDRLILMFADLLRQTGFSETRFAGHIGGDDFFMGVRDNTRMDVITEMNQLGSRFRKDAESFYDPETLENGFMMAMDRENKEKQIPLITVSIAILEFPRHFKRHCSIESAGKFIAKLKKVAKHSETRLAFASITDFFGRPSQITNPEPPGFYLPDPPVKMASG